FKPLARLVKNLPDCRRLHGIDRLRKLGVAVMPYCSIRWAVAGVALGLLLGACESTKSSSGGGTSHPSSSKPSKPSSPAPAPSGGSSGSTSSGTAATPTFSFKPSGDPKFDAWRTAFAAKAAAAGRKQATIVAVLDGLTPIPDTVQVASFDNQ